MTSKKLKLISFFILFFSLCVFSVQLVPIVIIQDGIDTDTMLVQELFTVKDFQLGVGFNLKRFGVDIGYITPYLFRGIIVHAGIFHRWEDLNKKFLPTFGIGISLKF